MADKTMHHVVIGSDTYEIVDSVARVGAEAAFATDTASGSVASFPDGADGVPVKSLSVGIEPAQSGSGDPSPTNIREISGWDAVKVFRTGKNLFPNKSGGSPYTSSGITFTYNDDGTMTINGTASANVYSRSYAFNTFHLPTGTYTVSIRVNGALSNNNDIRVRIGEGAPDYGYKTITVNGKQTVTLDKSGDYSFTPMVTGGTTLSNAIVGIQVESGDAVTEFANPSDDTYTIDLPQTVYGGTLDVSTGELTVTHGTVDMGTLNWSRYTSSTNPLFRVSVPRQYSSEHPNVYGLCSCYAWYGNGTLSAMGTSMPDKQFGFQSTSNYVCVRDDTYSDAASFKTAVSGQSLFYPLAEPQTLTLTPTQVKTLLGQNNIYADSGEVSVTYRADTKLYIEKLTAPTEDDMIADHAISANSFFMIGNTLYRATTAIASGATITVGTNAVKLSLSDALNALA